MIRYRTIAAAAALLALVAVPTPAAAAEQGCSGTAEMTWIDNSGAVFVLGSWRGDHTQVCSISQTWKGITADLCIAWVAKLDAAVATGKYLTIHYADAPSCSTVPAYSGAPAPVYVMLRAATP